MDEPRRSERSRKSRITYINGQPVLRLNTYTLEEGEPSVYREAQEEEVHVVPEKKRKISIPSKKDGDGSMKRIPENVWGSSNQKIGEDMIVARNKAKVFLVSILDILEPFITPDIKSKLVESVKQLPFRQPMPKTQILRQPKCIVNGEMRNYQLEGLSFLVSMFDNGLSAILADEMGLGKTLQTIAFLGYLKFERHVGGPHLVVCPLSVLSSWMKEFQHWCPELRVIRLHSSDKAERERFRREVLNDSSSFDVLVTTYEMVASPNMKMVLRSRIHWRYLVLDEGHKIKNERALISDAVRHIYRQGLLLLTGTPLQNNLHELWALFTQIIPDVFTDPKLFESIYSMVQSKCDFKTLDKAHLLFKNLSLRRLKVDVEKSLPPRTELKIYSPLSKMQHFWYRRLLLKNSKLLFQLEAESAGCFKKSKDGDAWKKLQSLLMQLRKCANHPNMAPRKTNSMGNALVEFISKGEAVCQGRVMKVSNLDVLHGSCMPKGFYGVLVLQTYVGKDADLPHPIPMEEDITTLSAAIDTKIAWPKANLKILTTETPKNIGSGVEAKKPVDTGDQTFQEDLAMKKQVYTS